jgi:hypothetical protein
MADQTRLLLISKTTVPPAPGFSYVQPETGRHIAAPNWRALLSEIIAHRKANSLPIGSDFEAEIQDFICRHIPDTRAHCHERGKPAQAAYTGGVSAGTGYDGREKWKEFHSYAFAARPTALERVAWLANFDISLPCGECKGSWKRLRRQHPLKQDATPEEFFEYSVTLHNFVNHKLGKPSMSVEEARALYA